MLSRRGLWPQAHRSVDKVDFRIDPTAAPPTVRTWLRRIRDPIRRTGCEWRAVIDSIRSDNQLLWQSLSISEQRRFLRHLRPFWDCHRHRLAPATADRLNALLESGQCVRHAGRVLSYRESHGRVNVRIRPRGVNKSSLIQVSAVLNCSGSESDYRNLENPLVWDLLDQGLIRPDLLSLGLDVAPDGALIGVDGTCSNTLYTFGPPQKGILWETTAVPEVRNQAAWLAVKLLRGLFVG